MKKLYCAVCARRVTEGMPKSGEWVSTSGTQRIPLYYCSLECFLGHLLGAHTMRRTARTINERGE